MPDAKPIDLTNVTVDINLELDMLDIVLLVTTGGVGYLARAAYKHFESKTAREIELQRTNLLTLIDESRSHGVHRLIVRVSPEVPYYEPVGAVVVCTDGPDYKELEITFDQ